jgi:hypothetical protein
MVPSRTAAIASPSISAAGRRRSRVCCSARALAESCGSSARGVSSMGAVAARRVAEIDGWLLVTLVTHVAAPSSMWSFD